MFCSFDVTFSCLSFDLHSNLEAANSTSRCQKVICVHLPVVNPIGFSYVGSVVMRLWIVPVAVHLAHHPLHNFCYHMLPLQVHDIWHQSIYISKHGWKMLTICQLRYDLPLQPSGGRSRSSQRGSRPLAPLAWSEEETRPRSKVGGGGIKQRGAFAISTLCGEVICFILQSCPRPQGPPCIQFWTFPVSVVSPTNQQHKKT